MHVLTQFYHSPWIWIGGFNVTAIEQMSLRKATEPIVKMATARDTCKDSDEYSVVKCCICAKKKTEQTADYYCCDCRKHLCTPCLGTHNEFNENHKVVQGLGDAKDLITERCLIHADELITLYCRQHNELLCKKCQLLEHSSCQEIQNIQESSDELNADPKLQAVPAQLKSALDNINKAIEELENHVACIQKNGDGFLKDLEDSAKKLLSRIEELREKGKSDIKSKQEELLSEAKQHRLACILTKNEINLCLDKITMSKEWKANMFVLKKKGLTITQKVDTLYNDSDSLIWEHNFYFITDMKTFDSLKGLSSLVNEVRKIKARIPEDKEGCDIYDCCPLSDGSLVIADFKNKKLKRVDPSSRTVTQYCDTESQPCSVCCIGPQEIAVTFPGSTKVHEYNTVSLTRTRTLEFGHRTEWIACHDELLYCAGRRGTIVYIHDVSSGRQLRKISKDTDGFQLFSNIQHIAVNSSGDRLYVADERGIGCVGTDGRPIFFLSEKYLGLSGAWGVTTDHHGHVFVSGVNSHNVVKVTEDGHVVTQILSKEDGVTYPDCLSYDVTRSSLYVGGGSDHLLMVEWK